LIARDLLYSLRFSAGVLVLTARCSPAMVAAPRPFTPLPTQPSFVSLSTKEKESGRWSRANMQRAMEILHRDGLLAVSGLVDPAHVEALRESMLATAQAIKQRVSDASQYNHGIKSNFLMSAPLSDPDLRFEDVFANPFVHQLAEGYLGPGIKLSLLTANCAVAGATQRQNVHKDAPWLHPNCPGMLNTNLALSDFTPENGSTEFWLGSHVGTTGHDQVWPTRDSATPLCDVAPDVLEARRPVRPGAQIRVPMGTVILRDMRTWHAGMPNLTNEDRIMTAVGYAAAWWPEPERRMKAPLSARPLLASRTDHALDFIPDGEWEAICQDWDLASETSIKLPDVPGHRKHSRAPEGEDEWVALNEVQNEEKFVGDGRDKEALPAELGPAPRGAALQGPSGTRSSRSSASLARALMTATTRPLTTPPLPTHPGVITLTEEERTAGKWSRASLQRAMELLHRDGVLAVRGIVDLAHVAALRESMTATAKDVAAGKDKGKITQFNQGVASNFLMAPPLTDERLLFEDVYANGFVHEIAKAYLGPGINLHLLTGNCAMPRTEERQAVHRDLPWIAPEAPFVLNMNLLLTDFSPHTGSTEFWLGSHHSSARCQLFPSADAPRPLCDVAPPLVEARRQARPGAQVVAEAGTVLLRDLRTWHAGMPNYSDEWRIMTAIEYSASWYPTPSLPQIAPLSARRVLSLRSPTLLRFVPDDEFAAVCQNWDFADPRGMKLPSVPGEDEGDGWEALTGVVGREDKWVKGEC
ncbi:hypothetical protein DMC30DRAFT_346619, partial [Rhodotorula diobovata]